ncbi:MAG: hypothetical protein JXC32_18355, partial [Anaerolineae bacterium]|nr:hypothetical protein [Anaerolineae bacterium]
DGTSVPYTYAAGEFERSRNLSQLTGNRETILDPRYTPTGGLKMLTAYDKYELNSEVLPYADDEVRDPSKYFVVYETGDNTTVAEGEAVPMDLYYARATVYGDYFDLEEKYNQNTQVTEYVFDHLENDPEWLSGEAANTCNAAGTFYYAIWNQWQEDAEENVSNSDAFMSRNMWLPTEVVTGTYLQPVASILYASTDRVELSTWPEDEDVILVGTGRDLDRIGNGDPSDDGIDNARWWSDSLGHEYEGRTMKAPPSGWIPGKHDFNFQVQDNEGNWSSAKTLYIWVAREFFDIYMPTITR